MIAQLKKLQHVCTLEDWEAALEKLEEITGAGFWSYFMMNWLSDGWVDLWHDLGWLLQRNVGLENTNNTTKSLFKQLSYIFLNQKKAITLHTTGLNQNQ